MTEGEKILSDKIDGLALLVGQQGAKLDMLTEPGEAPLCAVHEHRMGEVEKDIAKSEKKIDGVVAVQGKQHLLVLVLGALGYGIGMGVKSLFFKVGP